MKKKSANPPARKVGPTRESPAELGKNRAAFLTGFYCCHPTPTSVTKPLLIICGAIPIARTSLLDNALSLLEEYECELSSCERTQNLHRDPENHDQYLSARIDTLRSLALSQKLKVKEIARGLWPGQSELRDWYQVGIAVGDLVELITDHLRAIKRFQSPGRRLSRRAITRSDQVTAQFRQVPPEILALLPQSSPESPAFTQRQATSPGSQPTPTNEQATEEFKGKWEPLFDAAADLTRKACKRRKSRTEPDDLIEAWRSLANFFQPNATGTSLDDQQRRLLIQVDSAATTILDSGDRSADLDHPIPRDQFIYERMSVFGEFGTTLSEAYQPHVADEGWPKVDDPDKFREIARGHAQRWGLNQPPEQPPGRPVGS